MTSTLVATGGDGDNKVVQAYEKYVKLCVRSGEEPLSPPEWMKTVVEGLGPIVNPDKFAVPERRSQPTNVELVSKKFTAIMIDNGIHNSMTLFERAWHYVQIGNPSRENPRTKKQTTPCKLCSSIFCEWAD